MSVLNNCNLLNTSQIFSIARIMNYNSERQLVQLLFLSTLRLVCVRGWLLGTRLKVTFFSYCSLRLLFKTNFQSVRVLTGLLFRKIYLQAIPVVFPFQISGCPNISTCVIFPIRVLVSTRFGKTTVCAWHLAKPAQMRIGVPLCGVVETTRPIEDFRPQPNLISALSVHVPRARSANRFTIHPKPFTHIPKEGGRFTIEGAVRFNRNIQ